MSITTMLHQNNAHHYDVISKQCPSLRCYLKTMSITTMLSQNNVNHYDVTFKQCPSLRYYLKTMPITTMLQVCRVFAQSIGVVPSSVDQSLTASEKKEEKISINPYD